MVEPRPNETELEVLKMLWRDGPMSAREMQDRIEISQGWTISTTRTVLERMRAKGLLDRRSVHGMAVYASSGNKVQILAGAIRRLMRTVLEVNGDVPVAAFSGSALLSEPELAELEAIVNRAEAEE